MAEIEIGAAVAHSTVTRIVSRKRAGLALSPVIGSGMICHFLLSRHPSFLLSFGVWVGAISPTSHRLRTLPLPPRDILRITHKDSYVRVAGLTGRRLKAAAQRGNDLTLGRQDKPALFQNHSSGYAPTAPRTALLAS